MQSKVLHIFDLMRTAKSRYVTDLAPLILVFKIKNTVLIMVTKPAFTCSKLTIDTLEQGVKYVWS